MFGIGETITLSPPIDVLENITIVGHAGIRLSGGQASRVFHVGSGVTATLDRLTIADGAASVGGALLNEGVLTTANTTVTGNNATQSGGGIANVEGTLTITGSTVSGNTAADSGGGVWNDGGRVTIVNSTISGNTAVGQSGGGLYSGGLNSLMELTHVTVTGNTAALEGGGTRIVAGPSPTASCEHGAVFPDRINA